MSTFFDKQGKFILLLVGLLALCYVVAYATTRKPEVIPQDVVKNYLNALQQGDIRSAYALLSEEDKKYFDLERFKDFLRRQPHLQFLFGGSDINRGPSVREWLRYEIVENKTASEEVVPQKSTEVLVKITLPDIANLLGQELSEIYLFGEEHQVFSAEQRLGRAKRLEAKLRNLAHAPKVSSYHEFILVYHKGQWRLSVPEWRVEAMLYEAKENLVRQNTAAAARLLEEASNFVLKVNDLTRKTFVSEAIAGKHMLRYLPNIAISPFALEKAQSGCPYLVSLGLTNQGRRTVRSAELVVQFLGEDDKVVNHQVVTLNRAAVEKRNGVFLPSGETVKAKVCLTPPRDWSGRAKSHISWLTFVQEAD